ncbi:BASS family bile acid:Na+ symporter [Bacillus mesophilus]|uniref:Bile acid:sodium symporter family protein n=1 Tax=Bacillus mesophilus TaxID=1808955 RepID=A0A6M0QBM8_9BACI|nr:bile acid:sodium symporter [Bacillus mesophilus]MBM7663011.1 BASS family bile acid:Na+ symporter [Bacillus mesophilus]NEY73667.1 bile acid:sodium symporter family protein [Bacillus mesophilus]
MINNLASFLSKRLPVLILLVAVGTYFSPLYWVVSAWVPSLLLGTVIYFTGLSIHIHSVKVIGNKKKELVILVLLKWIFTVLLSIGLSQLFFTTHPEIAAGLILAGTVPSATAATVFTFLAGGNASLVVAASLLDVAISPIITPLSMMSLSGQEVNISFWSLMQSFILIVLCPLLFGVATQKLAPRLAGQSKTVTKTGSSLALLLVAHTIVGSGKVAISNEISLLPTVVIATLIQVVLPMITAYFICRKLKMKEEDCRAALFQVSLCNSALAAILAYQFIGDLGVVAPILNMIFNLSIGAYVANYFARNIIKQPYQKAV